MSQWSRVKLSEVTALVDYGHTASSTSEAIGPKFLRITDIQDGGVNWDSVPFCECNSIDELSSQLKTGDIVFARTGATTGKSFLIKDCPDRAIFASYLIRVRAESTIFPDYLAHFFGTPDYWSQIALNARGAAQLGVNATSLKSLSIPLPPIEDQKRIAAILDKAEALRSLRRQSIGQLDTLARSVFLEMFGDPVTNPKGWDIQPMSTLFAESPIFGTMIPPVPEPLGWLSLRVGNIQNWQLDLSDKKYIELSDNLTERYALRNGDLLMARAIASVDHLGKCIVAYPPKNEKWAFDSHLMRLRLSENLAEPEFVRALLMSPGGRILFLGASRQSTVQFNINTKEIATLCIPIPPLALQQEFADRIGAIEALKAQHRESLAKMDTLFASLQHRAFRGEL